LTGFFIKKNPSCSMPGRVHSLWIRSKAGCGSNPAKGAAPRAG
jgi:hypothetical protein